MLIIIIIGEKIVDQINFITFKFHIEIIRVIQNYKYLTKNKEKTRCIK